jgi:hypothetical protein
LELGWRLEATVFTGRASMLYSTIPSFSPFAIARLKWCFSA